MFVLRRLRGYASKGGLLMLCREEAGGEESKGVEIRH